MRHLGDSIREQFPVLSEGSRGGWVDPDGLWERLRLWHTGDEAFRIGGPGLAEHGLPASDNLIGWPKWTWSGVSIEMPPWRCSLLYQGKNERGVVAWLGAENRFPLSPA